MLRHLKNQLIIFSLVLALLAVSVIACTPQTPAEPEDGTLRIYAGDILQGSVTTEEMSRMKVVKRLMTVHSSSGDEKFDFGGVLLSSVLESIDPAFVKSYDAINVVGADGYSAQLSMDEVNAENNVYVMFADGDDPLPKSDGTPGGMRIVVLKDAYGQRFTNYLTRLELLDDEG